MLMMPTTTTALKRHLKIRLRLTIISALTKAMLVLSIFSAHIANAEIDLSPAQPVIQFATSDAKWLRQPSFNNRHIREL